MKVTKQKLTTWAIGIPALASVCLMHGCGYIGTPKESDVQVIPNDTTWPVDVDSAVAVQPVQPAGPVTTPYSVVKGDTLMVIAAQYDLRWQDVVAVNPGINPNRLRIGQVVQLPGQVDVTLKKAVSRASARSANPVASEGTITHKVQKGESLSVIARRYGVKVVDLKQANNLTSDMIRIGQTLKIVNPTRASGAGATPTPAAVKAPAVVAPVKAVTPAAADTPVTPVKSVPPKPAPTLEAADDAASAVVTPAAATPQSFRLYTVKENEDLYAVAIRWGVSPNEIKTLNNLTGNDLEPGKTIKIPNPQEPQH